MQQTTVSQILARLRLEGLVKFERQGVKSVYSVTDERVKEIMDTLIEMLFESEENHEQKRKGETCSINFSCRQNLVLSDLLLIFSSCHLWVPKFCCTPSVNLPEFLS